MLFDKDVTVEIDYPLERPVHFTIQAHPGRGITRARLIEAICAAYRAIYEAEGRCPGMFGIWGHCLGDLAIESISAAYRPDGRARVSLFVGS